MFRHRIPLALITLHAHRLNVEHGDARLQNLIVLAVKAADNLAGEKIAFGAP